MGINVINLAGGLTALLFHHAYGLPILQFVVGNGERNSMEETIDEKERVLVIRVIEALMTLFKSVKERKTRELLEVVKNGGQNGKSQGVQT